MALSSAAANGAIAGDGRQMSEVWQAMLQALEDSEPLVNFAEFKHAATLKNQVSWYLGSEIIPIVYPCNSCVLGFAIWQWLSRVMESLHLPLGS